MKKKVILFIATLFSTISYCQVFPGDLIELLSNKELKVLSKDESLQKYGYDDFYKDEKLKIKFDCCESYNSKYKSLVGKIFKVISYESYNNIIGALKYKLKIENLETGILYFDYDPKYDFKFPFEVVGGLTLPEGFYCKGIEQTTDKFTGEIKTTTDYSEGICFVKVEKDKKRKLYLAINETGATLNVGQKGLILLLENNKRIDKPEATIDVKPSSSSSGYIYSAFVELSDADLNLLITNRITDNRLFIYDGTIRNGEKLKEILKCLIK